MTDPNHPVASAASAASAATGLRRIVVLRHGRTSWNADGRFQGQADPPLDAMGRAQASDVAALIGALEPDVIVSSDQQRALQTAQPLARLTGLDVRAEPRLRERGLGHWEGLTRAEVAEQFPDELADWLAGRDVSRRGGEDLAAVVERTTAVVAGLGDVGLAVLVTHSATASALLTALLGVPVRSRFLGPLANCHWSEVRAEVSGWRLR
ncbi:MAG: histidine phosphatase family protein, partial [Janthinobacterium lividum]